MSQQDRDYHWLRAAEELKRGCEAVDPAVAKAHYELSYRYGVLAAQSEAGTPDLRLIHGGKLQPAA